MTIPEIHETLFQILIKLDEPFLLRPNQPAHAEFLKKGYWFLGAKQSVCTSFWAGLGDATLVFRVYEDCSCVLEFQQHHSISQALPDLPFGWLDFQLNELAELIDLELVTHKYWIKKYPTPDIWDSVQLFLQKDKPIINEFIRTRKLTAILPPIDGIDFQNNLKTIHLWRVQLLGKSAMNESSGSFPLRLERLRLINIGHFNEVVIELNQQVTCLIGENGTGKSTILKSLALALAGINDNTVVKPEHPSIQKMLKINKISNDKVVYAPDGEITLVYKRQKKYQNQIRLAHQAGETADSTGAILRDFNKITDYINDKKTTNGNYFVNLVLGFSQIKNNAKREQPQNEKDEYLKPRISEVTALLYDRADDSLYHFQDWILSLWDRKNKNKRAKGVQTLTIIFKIIQKIVGKTFELVPMKIGQSSIFVKTDDAPQGIPIQLLSQGYNNVIGWVGHFMQRLWQVTPEGEDFTQTPAICLIDEADTYLHPKWEQKILSVLTQHFTHTQFIITTHSPLILANLKDNYRIYKIEKAKNNEMIVVEHPRHRFNPYGAESSRILRLLMMTQERPDEVAQLIAKYQNAILNNDFENAQSFENQLKILIDASDPVLIEGEASLEARKMLQNL